MGVLGVFPRAGEHMEAPRAARRIDRKVHPREVAGDPSLQLCPVVLQLAARLGLKAHRALGAAHPGRNVLHL